MGFALLVALGLRRLRLGRLQILGRAAAPTLACLGLVLALAAGNAVQQIHWASDLLLFSRGAEIAPHNPGALTNLGMELAVRHYPAQAVTVLRQALALYPDNWHANYNLGYTFMLQHQYAQAEPYLEQAIRVAPYSAEQFAYLGVAQMELGKLQPAEGNLRQAIQRSPRAHHYHYLLGMILEKQGRKAEAMEQYRAELGINPNDADARNAVGSGQ
jgi:Tfp pilus assembly protein PilF